MTLEKHDLHHEFPEYKEQIHHLKMNDAHFARFFDEYHETDHDVHRIEQSAETLEQKKIAMLLVANQSAALCVSTT